MTDLLSLSPLYLGNRPFGVTPFASPTPPALDTEEDFVGVFSLPAGHCDEFVEQAATGFAPRHSRIPPAHLFGVFLYALFTHGHGWRHGVLICEATGLPFPFPEFFSVSASMRQHGPYRNSIFMATWQNIKDIFEKL